MILRESKAEVEIYAFFYIKFWAIYTSSKILQIAVVVCVYYGLS